MANFVQTMKDWRRMCSAMRSCDECPMNEVKCWAKSPSDLIYSFERRESVITEWAAEHPEPVYPSWIDWLMSEGVIPTNYMAANSTDSGVRAGTFYVTSKAFEHIPADIAQKLGIEPKEG